VVRDLSLCVCFNGHFPGKPGLASFIASKDDGSGGDNCSCKTCKVPVKSSPPTNQLLTFYIYRPDALPVPQPMVSKHRRFYCFNISLPSSHLPLDRHCCSNIAYGEMDRNIFKQDFPFTFLMYSSATLKLYHQSTS